jgi:hypothetical protein
MIEILKKNTDTFATTRSRLAGDFVCTRTSVDVAPAGVGGDPGQVWLRRRLR